MACGTAPAGCPGPEPGRVREFLHEHHGREWLFWLDTDMGFAAGHAGAAAGGRRPGGAADRRGLCFSQQEIESDGMGGWRCAPTPTIYDWITWMTASRGSRSAGTTRATR